MINKELLGKSAKDINEFFNSENNGLTRNHLTIEMNQAIHDLQIMNMGFIMSGLVYEQRKQFIRKIVDNKYDDLRNKLNEEYNMTIIMVLHDINQAIKYSHNIVVMKNGQIIGEGHPKDVINEKTIKTVYNVEGVICNVSQEEMYFVPTKAC